MDNLNLVKYPDYWNLKRIPARPAHLQVFNFEENYDFDNLWYDAIQVNQETIILIGPPLYNTAQYLNMHCHFEDQCNRLLEYSIQEMDRVCFTVIKTTADIEHLFLVDNYNSFKKTEIHFIKPTLEFQDKKVIVTISKNHPISWLKQWIDYHKVVHNVDGILLYNNQSTVYSSEELERELLRSDMHIKVIDYNVPFGCMGGGDWQWEGKSGNFLPWDSDFSQYIMMEHAKFRYLFCAKLVINADTDELLMLKNLTLDEFADYCQTSSNSVWLYKGDWIEPIDQKNNIEANSIPFDDRYFENYFLTTGSQQRGIGIKWMLAPKRNLNYQWMLHRTAGPHMLTDEITFGHFLAMNTSWSWERDKFLGNHADLQHHTLMKTFLDKWRSK